MRWSLCVLLVAVLATPALSAPPDEVPITCKLMDTALAEQLLGAPLAPPSFENVYVCAGFCPPGEPQPDCFFKVANPPGSGKATGVSIGLSFLSYRDGKTWLDDLEILWRSYQYDVRRFAWPHGKAFWMHQRTETGGWLEVTTPQRVALEITISGVADQEVARGLAIRIARSALARFGGLDRSQFPN